MSDNPLRICEVLDINSPYSYFLFESNTHELIDFDKEIIEVRPSNDDRRSNQNEFERSDTNLLYLNFQYNEKEKFVTISERNCIEILRFNISIFSNMLGFKQFLFYDKETI